MIVLVTGSRYATLKDHGPVVRGALLWATGAKGGQPGEGHSLWDGKAFSGIDGICHEMARGDFGWPTERFPANWESCDPAWIDPLGKVARCDPYHRKTRSDGKTDYCPTAGFRRNQDMITRLAARLTERKVVVGFPIPVLGSRGTLDCLERALHAGLPVISIPLTSKDAL